MWPDAEFGSDLIHSAASWEDVAATKRIEEVDGEERVFYTANWTLEIDSFWEDHGVPVSAGSPAGPMSGYFLEVYGQGPEWDYEEVTAKNFRDVEFGGAFTDSDHPRFTPGEEGETFVAAVVVATPFTRGEDDEHFWAGDPTYLEFNVHWIDELDDSTKCGDRGEQCCFLDNDRCEFGVCGQDEPDTCSGCGWAGESCCDDKYCATGKRCEEETWTCVEIPECGGLVRQGGNFGETVPVEMGADEGKGTFLMNTETAQDQMTIRDQNGKVILETPCIGTARLTEIGDRCLARGLDPFNKCVTEEEGDRVTCFFNGGVEHNTCQFTDGWTCQLATGICSRPFEYSGGSELTVEVVPNCGDTTDTVWAFEVSCP